MLIDLMATDRMTSYNVDLAQVIGLHPSIYLTELINISKKATTKGKVNEDGFFTVNRSYITERTTFAKSEQKDIEEILSVLGIVTIGEKQDTLKVNTDVLLSVFEVNKKDMLKITSFVKTKRKTKADTIKDNLKMNIYASNQELIDAYECWIDAVLGKSGWMSKEAVLHGQQVVDEYAKGDLDVALKIISIASINGYRDMSWAVGNFDRNFKTQFYQTHDSFSSKELFNEATVTREEVF